MGNLVLSLKEYYPWGENSGVKYPWERYLNQQFLNYEVKRLKTLSDWYKKIFIKSEIGSKVGGVSFYAVPVELNSSWKLAVSEFEEVAETDGVKYMGLSALYNSPQVLIFAIFPYDVDGVKYMGLSALYNSPQVLIFAIFPYDVPTPYSLIYIEEAKKVVVYNKQLNQPEYCILVEKWSSLSSDSIYLDVPYERGVISKVISEIVGGEDSLALSFQSPIMGAPYLAGSIGGVSLSSSSIESSFARELIKIIMLLAPPEYRNTRLPKRLVRGYNFVKVNGLKFHFAEIPPKGKNCFSGQYGKSYNTLEKELAKRFSFKGEYSIFSTLVSPEGSSNDVWIGLWKNFFSTEITLPYNLDSIVEADIDLTKFKKEINEEDIWIQVAHARQLQPHFNEKTDKVFGNTIQLMERDFDTVLADTNGEAERAFLIQTKLDDIKHNLVRVSQSLARSDGRADITPAHIKSARNLILDNFHGFLENPKVSIVKSVVGKKRKKDARYSIIRTYLINHPKSSIEEIFDGIKNT
ncbi:MAG: hypothetical protein ACTSRS_23150, partial [Candidatus Helarchaeota archaeon]